MTSAPVPWAILEISPFQLMTIILLPELYGPVESNSLLEDVLRRAQDVIRGSR